MFKLCAFDFMTNIFLSSFSDVFISILAILSQFFSLWMSRMSRENGPNGGENVRSMNIADRQEHMLKISVSNML